MAVEEKCHHRREKHNINIITNIVVQTADQGAHTPTALYFITFWVSMYPERKQFWTKNTQKLWFSPQISSKNYFYILEFSTKAFWQHGKMWAITPTAAYMSAVNTVSVTYVKGWSRVCAHSTGNQKKSHSRKTSIQLDPPQKHQVQYRRCFAYFSFSHFLEISQFHLHPESCISSSTRRRNPTTV